MSDRDRSAIDQKWIRDYCDQLLKVAASLGPNSPMAASVVQRVDHIHDLVDAWQQRNIPIDERVRR